LLIGELPGRLDALCRALQPGYAQKTVVTKSGEWFSVGSCAQQIGQHLEDSANLPDPDVIAAEIAEDLHARSTSPLESQPN
jgi:hypothetical protein